MHSSALALNWQVWRRHRWGLAASLAIVAGICVLPQAFPRERLTSQDSSTGAEFMVLVLLPLCFVMPFIVYAFSHAELGARAGTSGFPGWMLTLPVRTPWLVLWPMLSAAVIVALVWMAVAWLALNRMGIEVPIVWPAIALACTFVWIQAIDWSPLGFLSKAVLAGVVLASLWTGLLRDETHRIAFVLSPLMLLAGFAAAVWGVERLRRGGRSQAIALPWMITSERTRPFASATGAQLWLEWQRNGMLYPVLAIGCVALLAIAGVGAIKDAINGVVAFSLMLAPLIGLILGKPEAWSRQVRLPTFMAGRPLTCGELVMAKFRMTALSLAAAWLILGFALLLFLATSNFDQLTYAISNEWPWHAWPRRIVLLALIAVAVFGYQLLNTAGTFAFGMSGRFWMLFGALFCYLGVLPNLMALDAFSFLKIDPIEWLLVFLAVKLSLAAWAVRRSLRLKLLTVREVCVFVLAWGVTVGCALLAAWLWHPGSFMTTDGREVSYTNVESDQNIIAALLYALFCPLARIAFMPLALAWNRHR